MDEDNMKEMKEAKKSYFYYAKRKIFTEYRKNKICNAINYVSKCIFIYPSVELLVMNIVCTHVLMHI